MQRAFRRWLRAIRRWTGLDVLEPRPTGRFEWERIVRRVRMDKAHRYLALTMATYGNLDGTKVMPGVPRLARVMGVSEPTVKRGMKWLRETGFILRTKQGNRWEKMSDQYRLTIPVDILELEMLSPEEDEQDVPLWTDVPEPSKSGDH